MSPATFGLQGIQYLSSPADRQHSEHKMTSTFRNAYTVNVTAQCYQPTRPSTYQHANWHLLTGSSLVRTEFAQKFVRGAACHFPYG